MEIIEECEKDELEGERCGCETCQEEWFKEMNYWKGEYDAGLLEPPKNS